MNKVDEAYLNLLRDIMENGVEKDTRAGRVKSLFGRQLRFDLKEGFPLLVYYVLLRFCYRLIILIFQWYV